MPVAPEDLYPNSDHKKSKWGNRPDGTPKGAGFFGELKLPDGGVATEYSMGVHIDGQEQEIPTIVPTLTKSELDALLNDIIPNRKPMPDSIVKKAVEHARKRLREGKSPFADDGEQGTAPGTTLLGR